VGSSGRARGRRQRSVLHGRGAEPHADPVMNLSRGGGARRRVLAALAAALLVPGALSLSAGRSAPGAPPGRGGLADVLKVAIDMWDQQPDAGTGNEEDAGQVVQHILDEDWQSKGWSSMTSAPRVRVAGSCSHQHDKTDGNWTRRGATISGRSWFANGAGRYLYWDPSCDGKGFASAWVIDSQEPNPEAVSDLDGDGACAVDAWTYSESLAPPFGEATWRMWCGGGRGWRNVPIQMAPVAENATA